MDFETLRGKVMDIMQEVKRGGDAALLDFGKRFDRVELSSLRVTEEEFTEAALQVSDSLKEAIDVSIRNVELFHSRQRKEETTVETMPGVVCWRKSTAIQRVGLYIPGGTAPLFSTLVMLGVPAKVAGCPTIVLCTPPNQMGKVHPAILYTARRLGLTEVFKIGGSQAIAAMTFGTESVPAVDKLFGPGNQWVTMAKVLAQQSGVAIDMPAGPSEVLVVADKSANPAFVAADLLSQAEHGADSQVVLVTESPSLIDATFLEIEKQLERLPRRTIAQQCLENSVAISFDDLGIALDFSNQYAPEHLILSLADSRKWAQKVLNAGSVFMGHFTPESVGDYASGTNHTLPTAGAARAYSGVSLDSFLKWITFQELTQEGLGSLGPHVETMAQAEELMAHAEAVSVRLRSLNPS
jgi:histidinol dehydrogenase